MRRELRIEGAARGEHAFGTGEVRDIGGDLAGENRIGIETALLGPFDFSQRVVEQAAEEGNCVIVGRGSQHFLRDRKDTLRFFLYASREAKVRRLISQGKTESEAQALVDTVDHERAAFIKQYFRADWPNRSLYHAMISTDEGQERAIQVILGFLRKEIASSA